MTLCIMILLIMTILVTLNMGAVTYNDISYNKCHITRMFFVYCYKQSYL